MYNTEIIDAGCLCTAVTTSLDVIRTQINLGGEGVEGSDVPSIMDFEILRQKDVLDAEIFSTVVSNGYFTLRKEWGQRGPI